MTKSACRIALEDRPDGTVWRREYAPKRTPARDWANRGRCYDAGGPSNRTLAQLEPVLTNMRAAGYTRTEW